MVQAPSQPTKTDQHFVYSGLSWEGFKTLQTLFESPGVRVAYFQEEVELLTVSDRHGLVAENLGYLLEMHMLQQGVRFIGFGDFSMEIPSVVSAQADKSYCFDQRKPLPDLAIEVVITGERETKLRRYAALGVPEVWFWIEGKISIYRLDNGRYTQTSNSVWLPELDVARLAMCVTIEFRSDAVAAFTTE